MSVNKFTLNWLFLPYERRLPNNIPTLTALFPRLLIVRMYFPTMSVFNQVKN